MLLYCSRWQFSCQWTCFVVRNVLSGASGPWFVDPAEREFCRIMHSMFPEWWTFPTPAPASCSAPAAQRPHRVQEQQAAGGGRRHGRARARGRVAAHHRHWPRGGVQCDGGGLPRTAVPGGALLFYAIPVSSSLCSVWLLASKQGRHVAGCSASTTAYQCLPALMSSTSLLEVVLKHIRC